MKTSDKMDLALRGRLRAGSTEKLPILVTFRGTPTHADLEALDLTPVAGPIATGELDAAAVEALAARADVEGIVYRTPDEPFGAGGGSGGAGGGGGAGGVIA